MVNCSATRGKPGETATTVQVATPADQGTEVRNLAGNKDMSLTRGGPTSMTGSKSIERPRAPSKRECVSDHCEELS